jgi:hypothetical protein
MCKALSSKKKKNRKEGKRKEGREGGREGEGKETKRKKKKWTENTELPGTILSCLCPTFPIINILHQCVTFITTDR